MHSRGSSWRTGENPAWTCYCLDCCRFLPCRPPLHQLHCGCPCCRRHSHRHHSLLLTPRAPHSAKDELPLPLSGLSFPHQIAHAPSWTTPSRLPGARLPGLVGPAAFARGSKARDLPPHACLPQDPAGPPRHCSSLFVQSLCMVRVECLVRVCGKSSSLGHGEEDRGVILRLGTCCAEGGPGDRRSHAASLPI